MNAQRTGLLGAILFLALSLALLSGTPVARGEDASEATSAYTGSAVCARCHKREHELWATSSHALTFEAATAETLPKAVHAGATVVHPPGTTTFRAAEHGLLVETQGPDGQTQAYPLTHVVGRMRIRMFVTTLPDGRRQVLPGMLEEPTQAWFDYSHLMFGAPGTDWDTPPIIEPGSPSFWTGPVRSFGARCATCHASGAVALKPEPGEPYGPRASWRALGVDCEACHGPGAAHAAAWKQLKPGQPLPRLERLDTERALDVCLRCHMEGEVVQPGFEPGDDLFEFLDPTLLLDPERVDPAGRALELIYDGLPFLSSRCAQEGELTCASCHDAHGGTRYAQLRQAPESDGLCVGCHAEIGRRIEKHTFHPGRSTGSRCVACHMPSLTIERGHGAVRDHSISIPRPAFRADRVAVDACTWCHTGGLEAPKGAPRLTAEKIAKAYGEYWPGAGAPPSWARAIADARLEADDAGAALLDVLASSSLPRVVRASAAALLGRRDDVPLASILELCRDEDSLIRRNALRSLARHADAAADEALATALSDDSAAVRSAAARTALQGWARVQKNAALLRGVIGVLEEECNAVPNDDMRWFRLGAAREMAGDVPGAIDAYGRQVMLDPFATNIHKHLQNLKKR